MRTLALFYLPDALGAIDPRYALAAVSNGATVAGYIPPSALMPSLAPDLC